MRGPDALKIVPDFRIDTALVADDEGAQHCRGDGRKMRVEKLTSRPADVFDPMPEATFPFATFLNVFVVPEEGRDVDAPPGQIADVIEAARRMKIARRTEFGRKT